MIYLFECLDVTWVYFCVVSLDHIIMDLCHILRKNQLKGRVEALHHLGGWSYLDCHNQERSVMLGKDGVVALMICMSDI